VAAWREGATLVGVVLASVLPSLWGWGVTLGVLAALLLAALFAWSQGPRPVAAPTVPVMTARADLRLPWRRRSFRRLMAVFVLNGMASAMPATLVLFFVSDRLQTPAAQGPLLAAYFVAAAASLPLWLAWVRRVGLALGWLTGMGLAIGVFVWAALLGPGDVGAFAVVCVLSGLALGADLVLPSALLAGIIADADDRGRHEGAYFGWWNLAAKGNLALAAGLALPVLELLGYTPGSRDPAALQALSFAYALLPCVLKAMAAGLLWHGFVRQCGRAPASASPPTPAAPPA
jgi:Na+/melibiose symporter-like transporter